MIPVDQTIFLGPRELTGEAEVGNCFQACVASVLELPLAEVPHFCSLGDGEWWEALQAWLAYRGLEPIYLRMGHEIEAWPDEFFIMGGDSFSGPWHHCVVARGAEIVHDPNPARRGLKTKLDAICLRKKAEPYRGPEFEL